MLITPRWVGRLALLVIVLVALRLAGFVAVGAGEGRRWSAPRRRLWPCSTDVHQPGQPVDQEQVGRRVSVRGSFDPDRELLVVDRQESAASGCWVFDGVCGGRCRWCGCPACYADGLPSGEASHRSQ